MSNEYNNTPENNNGTNQWNAPDPEGGAYRNAGNGQRESFGSNQQQQTPPASNPNPDYGKPLYERENRPIFGTGYENAGDGNNGGCSGGSCGGNGPQYQPPSGGKPSGHNNGNKKLIAVAVVCALAGGLVGGTLGSTAGNSFLRPSATVQVSDRTVSDVKEVKVDGKTSMTNAENYAANVNSVVSINVGTQANIFGQTVQQASSGSGFILTADGYILTNYHVIAGGTTIDVTLHNGETYKATYIGGEEEYDIAVIKIDVKGLTPVVIGDSDSIHVGDDVVAVGNPLGELTFSLTSGSVSSANRAISVEGTPFNMIQVDCSINPGNSGGPLFNTYGEVIGIVSAKYSSYANTTVEGLGFAIPINDVYAMVKDIMENGNVTNKAYLGITGSTITQEMQLYNLPVSEGVFVYSIEANGPAAQSGIRAGDIIVKVGDKDVGSMEDLLSVQKKYRAGDQVKITVNRSGEEIVLDVTYGAKPQDQSPVPQNVPVPQQPAPQQPQQPTEGDLFDYIFGNPFGY